MKKPKRMKAVLAWGGFVADRLDWAEMDTGWADMAMPLNQCLPFLAHA